MKAIKKHIMVDNETRAFIVEAFGCSKVAVWKALTFRSDSDLCKRIRTLALQRGGLLIGVNEVREGLTASGGEQPAEVGESGSIGGQSGSIGGQSGAMNCESGATNGQSGAMGGAAC